MPTIKQIQAPIKAEMEVLNPNSNPLWRLKRRFLIR